MRYKVILVSLITVASLWGWRKNGNPVCQTEGDQFNILAEALTNKRIAVAWLDRREGENTAELYLQVINSLGNPLFTKDGIKVCDVSSNKRTPAMATDGENVYLVWVDHRVSVDQFDIYMGKINGLTGEREFDLSGLPISIGPATEKEPQLCLSSDGESWGAWIVWRDYRATGVESDVYINYVTSEGKVLHKNGVCVCSLPANQGLPVLVPSGEKCLLFWLDFSSSENRGLWGARLTKELVFDWDPKLIIPYSSGKVTIKEPFTPEGGYFFPYAVPDMQQRGAIITYDGIYQRVDSLGNPLWDFPPKSGTSYHLISTQVSGVIGCWGNHRPFPEAYSQVFATQIDSSANLPWGESLQVWKSPYYDTASYDTYPTLTDDSYQGAVLTWVQSDYTGNKLLITRVDFSGKIVWDPPVIISDSPYEKAHPFVIKGPNKGYIVVYEENHLNTGWDIMADYVDSTGRKGIGEKDERWEMLGDRILSINSNPFDKSTVISFQLSAEASIGLKIYDASGRVVRTLLKAKSLEHRAKSITWDGRDDKGQLLSSGVYFIRFKVEDYSKTQKVILFR